MALSRVQSRAVALALLIAVVASVALLGIWPVWKTYSSDRDAVEEARYNIERFGRLTLAPLHGYPDDQCERFLTNEELARLGAELTKLRSSEDRTKQCAGAAITLLLLTGCRKSEILTLEWTDIKGNRLHLRVGAYAAAVCKQLGHEIPTSFARADDLFQVASQFAVQWGIAVMQCEFAIA